MIVWAIADLHLSFGVPNKEMDVFGEAWHNHSERIKHNWQRLVAKDDLVLIAGDISWAKLPSEVKPDLTFIDELPGTKVMIQGNHDYWWSSLSKVKSLLPPSCHAIHNTAFYYDGIAVAGSRLWDTEEFTMDEVIHFVSSERLTPELPITEEELAQMRKIFDRELHRLELSLKAMSPNARKRIAMTHYPPQYKVGQELENFQSRTP